MPVTLATPPDAVLAELARALPRIARSAAVQQRAPAITRAASRFTLAGNMRVARSIDDISDADALPMPVYVVGLDDLAKGNLRAGARLVLWSHIVATEAGPVSAEVRSDNSRFAQVSNSVAVGRARASLLKLAQSTGGDALDGEAAELRIPALHTSMLWIRGPRETFEVLDSALPELPEGHRYSAAELTKILRPIAEARLRNPEAEG
ncbi:MAG TPA: hypothetical protein VEQ60_16015 [Longimicrobium sp.]|nr:hypothetical protein [Longimicrobium sp.]